MEDERGIEISRNDTDEVLECAAFLASIAPLVGGPISNVLSGISAGRKFNRINEVLQGFAEDLRDLQSGISEQYVKTEDFEEILEECLRRVGSERSEEKRRIYRSFLTDSVKQPGMPYDEQLRILQKLEEIQPAHLRILVAFDTQPDADLGGIVGSPIQTLATRLPGISREEIQELVAQLNDLRVTNMTSLMTMMTPGGAANLQHAITPLGQSLMRYISGD